MKKRLIALLLVLVTVLGMLPATALAASSEEEALGEVNIYNGGQKLAYLSINGRIREQTYTYFNYVDSQGRTKEIPAYCVNPNTKGVPQSVAPGESIKYLAEEKGNDPKVMGIIANGYPTRGLSELKLENKYHAYYATKMALWCYLLPNWDISNLKVNPNLTGVELQRAQAILAASKDIYARGTTWSKVLSPRVTATPDRDAAYPVTVNGQQYKQQVFTLHSDTWVCNYAIRVAFSDPASVPEGTRIVDMENKDITTITTSGTGDGYAGKFKILYPASAVAGKTGSVQLSFTTDVYKYAVFYAVCAEQDKYGQLQNYMCDTDPTVTMRLSTYSNYGDDIDVELPDTGLKITKLEAGTDAPLGGAIFEVVGPDGATVGTFSTRSDGTVTIPLTLAGNYTVYERVAPLDHLLSDTPAQNIKVEYGKVRPAIDGMKPNRSFRSAAPMWAALVIPVLWLAALLATGYEDGMTIFDLMGRFSSLLERPFAIRWTAHTLKFMVIALCCYGMSIGLYYSSRENRRPGEEYGSAKWGDPRALCQKYKDPGNPNGNVILTMRVCIGMDGHKHRRNLNILVVGGSGSGKTRFFCLPGVLSANCSFLITDPKGEILRTTGHLLIEQGYDVKVFNLIDPGQSDCYNPFRYLRDEKDVLKLIDNLIKNTTPRNASSNDPFWEKAEIALDSALMLYLMSEAPPEEQNFETMLFMMEYAEVREEDEGYRSPLDLLFQALEEEQSNHVAVKQYKVFKQAAGKTAKSILISAAVRLAAFNIPQYAAMTARDDMDFGSLGERKRAIFCVIPINDASMNYLIGMLYTQCFQELYYRADEKYNGRLPVPVRVIQDEWANVAQPDSYPKILATCRSYNIGLNIIVQNIQNIKALYEKEWEGIIGNCDTLLFLGGGNEPTSLEFMSKLLGKETLDTRTRGQTRGRNGSSSTNYQQAGRELMMIDEIRMMDTDDAILLIRGEKPVLDKKYDITRHPNFKKSAAGGAEPYVHKPQEAPDYALPDLPYEFHALDDYDFIDMEDSQNEQEE